ncbi:unnamed protein product [Prorocentrum cordatum]|uniref:FACT complex subunit n=1 Tax=Prorocentrum cordatum TaxID=2364126 RepID=A0ABN9RIC2_9DINO|nr:unnamed protein product [Polarella glacialis]
MAGPREHPAEPPRPEGTASCARAPLSIQPAVLPLAGCTSEDHWAPPTASGGEPEVREAWAPARPMAIGGEPEAGASDALVLTLPGAVLGAPAPIGLEEGRAAEASRRSCSLPAARYSRRSSMLSMRSMASQLSVVLEPPFAITWHIELFVIGCDAEQWCARAVGSKTADAYRPQKGGAGRRDDEGSLREGKDSTGLCLFIPMQAREDSKLGRDSIMSMKSSDSRCGPPQELAEVRFTPIQGFRDNLSLPTNPADCLSCIAVLLVTPTNTSIQETVWDFQMRLSEIAFRPRHMRPHVVMLKFKTGAAQDGQLQELVAKWQEKVSIELRAHEEDTEEEIMEALAAMCRDFSQNQPKHVRSSAARAESQSGTGVLQALRMCPVTCAVILVIIPIFLVIILSLVMRVSW